METAARRCFVISPIGAAGSETRRHADNVFNFIVRPAMEELGIYAYRSDHLLESGKITEQMFKSLLTDDLCIALLTFESPNVFYELAIAQSAARPTVLLMERNRQAPFDLHDLRRIEYDLDIQNYVDRVYVNELIGHIRSIEQNGWRGAVPFAPSLSPLGGANAGLSLFEDSDHFGGERAWVALLEAAETSICGAGIAMNRWMSARARDLLIRKAKAGCDIRIMAMSPDNPAFAGMINEADGINNAAAVAETISTVQHGMSELTAISDRIRFKLIKTGGLHQQLVLTDKVATARLYCYSRTSTDAPVLYLQKPTPLSEAFDAEFEALWRLN
jgi:hypothetical protein